MLETATIRALSEADLPMVLGWRNHVSIRSVMFDSAKISFDKHREWFYQAKADPTRCLLIAETSQGAFGFVQFGGVEPDAVSDWGFYARPDAPKGSGMMLGIAALEHAFLKLRLSKVCGKVIERNDRSIRMHKCLGFHEEGILRDQHRLQAGYAAVRCFGLLQTEWAQTREALFFRPPRRNQGAR